MYSFERQAPGQDDVVMKILYCGICHSNLHMEHNNRSISSYPLIPGHEILGRVIEPGGAITYFKTDDYGAHRLYG